MRWKRRLAAAFVAAATLAGLVGIGTLPASAVLAGQFCAAADEGTTRVADNGATVICTRNPPADDRLRWRNVGGGVIPTTAPPTMGPPLTVVVSDGCDPNYGLVGQLCVAAAPPDNDCPGLMAAGLRNIPVIGTDVQRLDRDGDRIGCEVGDEDGRGRPVVRQQPLSRTG